MSDKLADTLAALERGERVPCPFCAKPLVGDHRKQHLRCEWGCGTWHYVHSRFLHRGAPCYERELAALREQNARMQQEHCETNQMSCQAIARLKEENARLRAAAEVGLDAMKRWLEVVGCECDAPECVCGARDLSRNIAQVADVLGAKEQSDG